MTAAPQAAEHAFPAPPVDSASAYAEIAGIEAGLAANPNDCDLLLKAARLAARMERHDDALQLYSHVVEIDPGRAEAVIECCELMRRRSRHREAIELLQQAIERHPAQPALWYAIARVMLDLDERERARIFFDEALRLDGRFQPARFARAALAHADGRAEDGLSDYDYILHHFPADPRAIIGRADILQMAGRHEEARQGYLRTLTLVRDPQIVLDRLQRAGITEFEAALSRRQLPPAEPNRETMAADLHLVFFQADARAHGTAAVEPAEYHALLRQTIGLARRRAPSAKIVILSDRHTAFDPALGVDAIVRDDVALGELMYERMRLQRGYLAANRGADLLFLDTDVFVNRDPAPVFDGSFDIGLVYRNDIPEAPFNGGVIFARGNDAALRFFDLALACYRAIEAFPMVAARHPDGVRRWWGDQYALAAVVGWTDFARRSSERMEVENVTIRCFPARDYNLVLEPAVPAEMVDLDRRYLIHLKGARKAAAGRLAAHLLSR